MSNKYAGTCYRCGRLVEPGAGVFEKTGRNQRAKWPNVTIPKWLTQHHGCAAKYRGTPTHYIFHPATEEGPDHD